MGEPWKHRGVGLRRRVWLERAAMAAGSFSDWGDWAANVRVGVAAAAAEAKRKRRRVGMDGNSVRGSWRGVN